MARSRVSNPARPVGLASRRPLLPVVRLPRGPSDVVRRHRGHRGIRTPDLLFFRQPLFRLSYMTVLIGRRLGLEDPPRPLSVNLPVPPAGGSSAVVPRGSNPVLVLHPLPRLPPYRRAWFALFPRAFQHHALHAASYSALQQTTGLVVPSG